MKRSICVLVVCFLIFFSVSAFAAEISTVSVNDDIEMSKISYDNPEFCKDWSFEQLNIPLFKVQMIRASNGEKTMVTPFKKVYKKHFKQGDIVELFNANSGSNPSLNYVTIINF